MAPQHTSTLRQRKESRSDLVPLCPGPSAPFLSTCLSLAIVAFRPFCCPLSLIVPSALALALGVRIPHSGASCCENLSGEEWIVVLRASRSQEMDGR
jgi:hypothetical protein